MKGGNLEVMRNEMKREKEVETGTGSCNVVLTWNRQFVWSWVVFKNTTHSIQEVGDQCIRYPLTLLILFSSFLFVALYSIFELHLPVLVRVRPPIVESVWKSLGYQIIIFAHKPLRLVLQRPEPKNHSLPLYLLSGARHRAMKNFLFGWKSACRVNLFPQSQSF